MAVSRVLAAVTVLAAGNLVFAQSAPDNSSQPTFSSAVEATAHNGTVQQFAQALVASGMPVGIVIAPEDDDASPLWFPPRGRKGKANGDPQALGRALAAFGARYPRYAARSVSGVLRIGAREGSPCALALERRLGQLSATGEAFAVVYDLTRAANDDASPYVPPGLVGSGPSQAEPYRAPVSLDLVDVSIVEALDELIRQAPGLGWAVRELPQLRGLKPELAGFMRARNRSCNVVLFARDSWTDSGDYVDLKEEAAQPTPRP